VGSSYFLSLSHFYFDGPSSRAIVVFGGSRAVCRNAAPLRLCVVCVDSGWGPRGARVHSAVRVLPVRLLHEPENELVPRHQEHARPRRHAGRHKPIHAQGDLCAFIASPLTRFVSRPLSFFFSSFGAIGCAVSPMDQRFTTSWGKLNRLSDSKEDTTEAAHTV